jgi:PhzF family phenazine biosynthesis protein
MDIPLYQVDAFTDRVFGGNPAAVCPLDRWLDDSVLQSIALENNLAETAFFIGQGDRRELRWFTPVCEMDLCGHATVAAAYVIMQILEPGRREIRFDSRSGELAVTSDGKLYTLDFPSRPPTRREVDPALEQALGARPRELWASRDWMAVFDSETEVRNLRPDMTALAKLETFAVIVTARGSDVDFVSRFFAPAAGVPEDPVTGSAHCTLIPYWADVLGKRSLRARQVSPRGGELWCSLEGDRVKISGHAVLFCEGTIHLP